MPIDNTKCSKTLTVKELMLNLCLIKCPVEVNDKDCKEKCKIMYPLG